ncbi:ROK family protein [uncultured Pseudokineococcus sp.]|uniref:ROK family protein n=1 Tax=uncultured Pseudokineococcus sp. TaxID=1642928 RepID=UPI00262819DD|nr:ROK family protein [uncultured Pseudokineococcus sp.]
MSPAVPTASAVGVDVGGTSTKGLRIGPDGAVLAEHRRPTPSPDPDGRRTAETVAAVVDALGADPRDAVGVALPGVVDEVAGTAVLSVNLGWRDVPATRLLEGALGRPVVLAHDVRAGAVAEDAAAAGASGDVPSGEVSVFVAVGTGLAAAVLVDGRPLVAGGWAGEVGQLLLVDGPHAGLRVEEVASAAATARRAGAPDALTVARRVRAGDPAARAVWRETVEALAGALAGLVVAVAPSRVVMGGGLALAGDLLLDPLAAELARRTPGLRAPHLLPAVHGDTAAARGAAMLARAAQDRHPSTAPVPG